LLQNLPYPCRLLIFKKARDLYFGPKTIPPPTKKKFSPPPTKHLLLTQPFTFINFFFAFLSYFYSLIDIYSSRRLVPVLNSLMHLLHQFKKFLMNSIF
jgi:hypothetical protein